MTEAAYWSMIRSAIRRAFRYWKPAREAKLLARTPYKGSNRNQKWEYQCSHCKDFYKDKDVQVDHIVPCGKLRCYEDIPGFIERLALEDLSGYQVLCKECHKIKTKKEREEAKQCETDNGGRTLPGVGHP